MNILNITVLTGSGADTLLLETDLPDGCWPYTGRASVKMDVANGQGKAYCESHFPNVPCRVIRC